MECYYHPDRDGTDVCAICGKSICKECGLEIAGKIYCKECLEKIVGLGIENNAEPAPQAAPAVEPIAPEPARLNKQPVDESIYQPQVEPEVPAPQEAVEPVPEIKQIQDDSPYNIKGNIETSGIEEKADIPQVEEIPQNEYKVEEKPSESSQDFIYPDHSYEPEPTSARAELEDKYEKYLDDLYFDDNVPLGEQLAKDEEEFGSLTRKPYQPKSEEPLLTKKPENETPEEMEARIRAEILAEKNGGKKSKNGNIHKLNYQEEKESMGVVDILLTIILIIVILVVIYYLIYVFVLHSYYPTFLDAIYGLSNPQNVINNILTPAPQ
jgi:hypothetical protein